MNKKPKWYVTKVIPKEDYSLLLTFADGKKGIYDFKPNQTESSLSGLPKAERYRILHAGESSLFICGLAG